jgi:hypothetical protein
VAQARRALAELGYIIRLSADLEYLPDGGDLETLRVSREEASRTIRGLYRSLLS